MIKLFLNLFPSTHLTRMQEYLASLIINATLVKIDKIYILQEGDIDENFKYLHEKIEYIKTDRRYSYRDFFEFINKNTTDEDINILSNTDIIFDYSIKEVSRITHDECYALSRWDGNGPVTFGNVSQDSWIFRGEINIPKYCEFFMGIPGCDNRIAWELKEIGYLVSNPSLSIRNFHIHASNFRTMNYETDRVPHPYLCITQTEFK